ncbi:FG-GAP repeat protein [Marinicella rhabdoformis]|uniref:FG-GAP repeat protein n=1 Tax=Marinicella rhabdoformis TaxID=2580566 RepID=UPI0012AED21A|nr:FG-GAP repeat protein [Marinicella rhabdoformis]
MLKPIVSIIFLFISFSLSASFTIKDTLDNPPLNYKSPPSLLPETVTDKDLPVVSNGVTSELSKEVLHEFLPTPEGIGRGENIGLRADVDNDTMILGVKNYAVIYEMEQGDWVEKHILRPPYEYEELFGKFVAIQGDIAVVGAPDGHGNDYQSGVVYVFRKNNDEWSLQQVITANQGQSIEDFGSSLAVNNGQIFVGDYKSDIEANNSGAVFVFEEVEGNWQQTQKLDFDIGGQLINVYFGKSLDVNDDYVVVGATRYNNSTGSVFVFKKENGLWVQSQSILASDAAMSGTFGREVVIQGDDLIVSALMHNEDSNGKLYFFEIENDLWTEQSTYESSSQQWEELLGTTMSLQDGVLVAGAYGNDDGGDEKGAAYVFEKDLSGWQFKQKIYMPGFEYPYFGYTVLAHENEILVANGYTRVYTFKQQNNVWVDDKRIDLNPGSYEQFFGRELDIDNNVAAFAATDFSEVDGEDVYQPNLYVFEKDQNDNWSLSFKQTYDEPGFFFGRVLDVQDNVVVYFNDSQLVKWEKGNNGWVSSQGIDLPFLEHEQGQTNTTVLTVIKKVLHTEHGIITLSRDEINKRVLIHQIVFDDNQTVISEILNFETGLNSYSKSMAYIDGLLYLQNVTSGNNPQSYVSVMAYDGNGWVEQSAIHSPLANDGQNFGSAFSASKNLLAIGAANNQRNQQGHTLSNGEVHMYKRDDNNDWVFEETITTTFPNGLEYFGYDLYLNDETLVVSARSQSGNFNKLMEFEYINGWQFSGYLESEYGQDDEFGRAFQGIDNQLLIGIPEAGFHGLNSGRATLYQLNETYTVSGSISNLLPQNSLKLKLNDREVISVNGGFTFDMQLPENHNYNVEIIGNGYPFNQSCQVNLGSGVVQQENISDIEIVCDDFVDLIFQDAFENP